MIKRRHYKLRLFLLVLAIVLFYFLVTELPAVKQHLANPKLLKGWILGFGILAPLAVIVLQFFQTTVSIVPSQITTIVAGFVFGPFLGLVYSLTGAFFGSMLIFSIARRYGKEWAPKFFEKKDLVHLNLFFRQKKTLALFLARMSPIFPNDLVSFGAGLTDIKLRKFNVVSTIGFIIQMLILAYFGSELSTGRLSLPLIIISIVISLLILTVIFERKIKKVIIKDFHKLEKEGKIVEKAIEREFRRI